jgi:hypothetical protein
MGIVSAIKSSCFAGDDEDKGGLLYGNGEVINNDYMYFQQ